MKKGGGAERKADPLRNGAGAGGVAALAVCFVFLLVASAAISGGLAGEELMYQLTIVGCVLGAFAGGLLAVRRCGSRALIVGLTTGGVLFLLLLTIGALCFETVSLEAGASACCAAPCAAELPPESWAAGVRRSLPGKNAENN